MDDEELAANLPADDQKPNNEVPAEVSMEERRRGVEHASDILDTEHSRIVERRTVENVMEDSYLRYSMSVIIDRALPDVRDGLKPVHRRILYSMSDTGLRSTARHRKSANVVGEVMGKYHPHGDSSIYDAMVRMAQDWSMRYMLINGQGNFGSMDGDPPAAMRYTEAKMARLADELLADIDKDTVDYRDNYDNTTQEPTVLPAKLPNLLLNGQLGIAVGMATNIPPHNLGELVDAEVELIDNPEATLDDLLQHVKGPDFPTGGVIYGKESIRTAYATGRGGVVTRGVAEVVEGSKGRHQIVITEIPYALNKENLVLKIADLVHEKKAGRHQRLARRDRPRHCADRHRPQEGRLSQENPQPTVQADPAATELPFQHDGADLTASKPRVLGLQDILGEHIKHHESLSGGGPSLSCARPASAPTSSKASRPLSITSTKLSPSSAPAIPPTRPLPTLSRSSSLATSRPKPSWPCNCVH